MPLTKKALHEGKAFLVLCTNLTATHRVAAV